MRRVLALLVVLSLARPGLASPCLERMAVAPSGDLPTFETETECELWETVVLLEGDVRTATSALDACQRAQGRLRALPALPTAPVLPAPPPTTDRPSWPWVVLLIAAAAAGGAAVGYLAGQKETP